MTTLTSEDFGRVQPQGTLEVDWSNPLTRDLRAAWVFGTGGGDVREVVNFYDATRQGTLTSWDGLEGGVGLVFEGTTGNYARIPAAACDINKTNGSMLAIARYTGSAGVARMIFELGDATDGDNFVGLRKLASDNVIFRYRQGGANTDVTIVSSLSIPSNMLNLCGCWDSTDIHGYLDGVKIASASRGSDIAVTLDQGAIGAKGQGDSGQLGTDVMTGEVLLALAWDRTLDPSEVLSCTNRPWGMFRTVQRFPTIFDQPAAAGGTILPQMLQHGLYASNGAA